MESPHRKTWLTWKTGLRALAFVALMVAAHSLPVAAGLPGRQADRVAAAQPVVPLNLSNDFYGLTNVGFGPCVLVSWLGMLPGGCLYVYLGAAGKAGLDGQHRPHGTLEHLFFGLGLLAAIVMTVVIVRVTRRTLEKAGVPEQ